jgi:ABC-type dipeptide/oligopeptide/nickel transport system permease subunit
VAEAIESRLEPTPFGQMNRMRTSIPRALWSFTRHQPLGAAGAVVVLIIVVAAILAPWLRTSNPQDVTAGGDILAGPSWSHWFGTTRSGLDVYSRVLYGARPSLIIGIVTVTIGLGTGILLGIAAGYWQGVPDMLISRLVELIVSFPPIITGMIVATALHPGLRAVIIAITLVVAASMTRVIRGAVLQERELAYVQAAVVTGASTPRVMLRHILPNILPLAIVLASALLPTAILFESALTFIGVGLPPGEPSWGADVSGQSRTYFTVAPWMAIFPGAALSLTILAFNLLGDAMRDVLDPRLRGSAGR